MTSVRLTEPISAAGRRQETFSWPSSRFSSARTAEASRTGSFTRGLAPPVFGKFIHEADVFRQVAANDGLRAGDRGLDGLEADLAVLDRDDEVPAILHAELRPDVRRDDEPTVGTHGNM